MGSARLCTLCLSFILVIVFFVSGIGFGSLTEAESFWADATATKSEPNVTDTPDLTATYDQLMVDAVATVTAASWTMTPLPTQTTTPTPRPTDTPTMTPLPTATPIPPQRISAANLEWLQETAWVKIFGDPEEIYWTTDGRTLVASTGFTAALFDPANLQAEPLREKHVTGFVNAVAVSPDGVTVAYGDGENNVVLWNIRTDAETILRGHTSAVQGLAFSADGSRLASAAWDSTVRIWDVATGEELAFFDGFTAFAYAVAFRPDGQLLAAVGQHYPNEGVRLWNTQTFEELPMLPTDGSVACVAFSPDGRLLVAGEEWDVQWHVWDAQTLDRVLMLGQSTQEPGGGACSVAFSPDSRLMATGGGDNLIHIWDVAAGSPTFGEELTVLRRHTDTVGALAFSPDGTQLVSGGGHNDSTIRLWAISPEAPTNSTDMETTQFPDTQAASPADSPSYTGVVAENTDLRTGPGTQYTVIGTIGPDVTFAIEGRNQSADWLRVHIVQGAVQIDGWLYAPQVITQAPILELPVVSESANDNTSELVTG